MKKKKKFYLRCIRKLIRKATRGDKTRGIIIVILKHMDWGGAKQN